MSEFWQKMYMEKVDEVCEAQFTIGFLLSELRNHHVSEEQIAKIMEQAKEKFRLMHSKIKI